MRLGASFRVQVSGSSLAVCSVLDVGPSADRSIVSIVSCVLFVSCETGIDAWGGDRGALQGKKVLS